MCGINPAYDATRALRLLSLAVVFVWPLLLHSWACSSCRGRSEAATASATMLLARALFLPTDTLKAQIEAMEVLGGGGGSG